MTFIHIIFYGFSILAIASGLMVVTARNSMHSVLFLVLAFFAMAGLWVLLDAEFLALILVLVYVGAVMTLFLFVVMMLNVDIEPSRESFVRYLPIAALIVAAVIGISIFVLNPERFSLLRFPAPVPLPADYSNTADLGSVLYTSYAYPFEVAGTLLLAAIIAAITLSHHKPKNRKIQSVSKQVARKAQDSVKLLNLPSEIKKPSTGLRDNSL